MKGYLLAWDSGDESEAPPSEIANYRGRNMSEMEYINGFKREVIAGSSGLAIYFAKEHSDLNLMETPFDGGDTWYSAPFAPSATFTTSVIVFWTVLGCLHVAVSHQYYVLAEKLLVRGACVKSHCS